MITWQPSLVTAAMGFVEYEVVQCEYLEPGPCQTFLPETVLTRRYCDQGFIAYERVVISRHSTKVDPDRCWVVYSACKTKWTTFEACSKDKPLPKPEPHIWIQLLESTHQPMKVPADPVPKESVDPPTVNGCVSVVIPRYTARCLCKDNVCLWEVTRILEHQIRSAFPSGLCHTLIYETRETILTDEPCLEGWPDDIIDKEALFKKWISSPDRKLTEPIGGRVQVAPEQRVPGVLRDAVRAIRDQEAAAGEPAVTRGRMVYVTAVNGIEASHEVIAELSAAGGELAVEVAIEGTPYRAGVIVDTPPRG